MRKGGKNDGIHRKDENVQLSGQELRLLNQSCPDWTAYYGYPGIPSEENDNLHDAGCGIFATCHLIDWFTGEKADPDELAAFACRTGGRGDDGTDRPELLRAMQQDGRLEKVGLCYDFDGLRNDHEALWSTLEAGGCALTNLRVGHIVAIVDHRVKDGERQLLIIDSSRDSVHPSVRGDVREVVPGSEIYAQYVNRRGVRTGGGEHYAMYWVPLEKTSDFNLLHRV